jgi:flagellar FliL protein
MSKAATTDAPGAQAQMKLPVMTMLIVVILGVLIGLGAAGGGVYFLAKSGKLSLGGMTGPASSGGEAAPTHPMVLEPFLVNLADEGGHAYLRLGLTLDVEDTRGAAAEKPKEAPKSGEDAAEPAGAAVAVGATAPPSEIETSIRDTVLTVLGQQTSAWLLGPDGKEHLKLELQDAIAKREPRVKVKDLFISDFLVQI